MRAKFCWLWNIWTETRLTMLQAQEGSRTSSRIQNELRYKIIRLHSFVKRNLLETRIWNRCILRIGSKLLEHHMHGELSDHRAFREIVRNSKLILWVQILRLAVLLLSYMAQILWLFFTFKIPLLINATVQIHKQYEFCWNQTGKRHFVPITCLWKPEARNAWLRWSNTTISKEITWNPNVKRRFMPSWNKWKCKRPTNTRLETNPA